MGAEEPKVLGGTAIRPKTKSGVAGVMQFLHDKDQGTYCGRTCKSWLQITAFYIVYYTCLMGIWYGLFSVFFLTIDMNQPKWQTSESIIGVNPGIGIRPSQPQDKVASSLLFLDLNYDGVNEGNLEDEGSIGYATRMKDFFKVYEENKNNPNATLCSGDEPNQSAKNQFCKFETSILGECSDFPYGYNSVGGQISPCVFVKLNRIFNLVPQAIESKNDFPEDSSESIKQKIEGLGFPKNKVFIDCQGEFPADRELLQDSITYFPNDQSISLKYFPMTSKNDNENAIVAVKFKELPVGRLVHVICKAYYKGVEHSKKEKRGLVTFQLLVKDV